MTNQKTQIGNISDRRVLQADVKVFADGLLMPVQPHCC